MVGQVDHLPGPVDRVSIGLGYNRLDTAAKYHDCLVFEHLAKGLNRDDPAGIDANISGNDGVSSHETGLFSGDNEFLDQNRGRRQSGPTDFRAWSETPGVLVCLKGQSITVDFKCS